MMVIHKDFNHKELEIDILAEDRSFSDKVKRSIEQLEKYGNISSVQYVFNVVNETSEFIGKAELLQKLDVMADVYINKLEKFDIHYDIERAKEIRSTGIYDEKNVLSRVRDIFDGN